MIKNKTGAMGEVYAARYLRDKGYDIVSANYRCRFGEADLIAFCGKILCFVEVKTRQRDSYHRPFEAVDEIKQQRLVMTAKSFIAMAKIEAPVRFDVCEVMMDEEPGGYEINYIENAFDAG